MAIQPLSETSQFLLVFARDYFNRRDAARVESFPVIPSNDLNSFSILVTAGVAESQIYMYPDKARVHNLFFYIVPSGVASPRSRGKVVMKREVRKGTREPNA